MKISQREMILGVITLATVLGLVTYAIVNGKLDEHKAKKTEIESLRQQIRLDERRIKMQDEWIAELNELQKDLRVFDTKLKNPSPELMKTVNMIANKHQLDIKRNQPRGEKPTDDLYELGINCTWEGKLEALVGFLAEIQQQGVRYDVRSLNVAPVGKNTNRLKGNMVINCAYTRKPGGKK
ncbi:type 4a pilus biogenesis protein PilO [Pontiellaceae bacterium B12227]|nr:type 4a pilus biogenesis protein PilO [Pontiellaceae bacterium B12227]